MPPRPSSFARPRPGAGRLLPALLALLALPVLPAAAAPAPAAAQEPGGAVVRAVRADRPPTIDGVLDEPFWSGIEPVDDFRQRVPVDGAPSSERTELRVAFDDRHLYFAVVLHDSDPDGIRRSILHREGRIDQDDNIRIGLDTYHDRRNAYIFEINPFGTQGDALITDESMTLADWNWEGVYDSEARITETGWTVEAAVPFTTIRFADAAAPTMGILMERTIRRKNERVYFPHVGQEFSEGLTQVSQYAVLTGLEGLRRGRYMEAKPFAIGGGTVTGRRGAAAGGTDAGGGAETGGGTQTVRDLGLDFKYSITSNLTLDATLNPDFAQVEADNVQINLTRFSLFFPEKREFFLERAGLFDFGDMRETEIFFSRRVGIANDIAGGGRLTGQAGPVSIGALSLHTLDAQGPDGSARPGGLNSVARLRADPFPRTTIGGIATSLDTGAGSNRVVGGDLQVRFGGSSYLEGWVARSSGRVGGGGGAAPDGAPAFSSSTALSVAGELRSSLLSGGAGFTRIPADFDPALGFVRRRDMQRYRVEAAFFPRFERSRWARRLVVAPSAERIDGLDGAAQSTSIGSHARFVMQSGDWAMVNLGRRSETLRTPARIQGVELGVGEYAFGRADFRFSTNDSRTLSARGGVSAGGFWGGTRTELSAGGMWKTGPHLTIGADYAWNTVSLPVEGGDFTRRLFGATILAAASRSLFANALVQYDDVSSLVRANVRVNWIHTPGSDLFVVFDAGYLTGDLLDPRTERWRHRTGVVKVTYLKAF